MPKYYCVYMNYLRVNDRPAPRLMILERSIPRAMALRAPPAFWPVALGFSLFSLWLSLGF